ncbi:MAG: hypothetical protein DMF69_07570 [Acidobacteria bacterium]|nr:MAG: hypothetical protein DMF69_07570 [Acidobacteriota bacterium]
MKLYIPEFEVTTTLVAETATVNNFNFRLVMFFHSQPLLNERSQHVLFHEWNIEQEQIKKGTAMSNSTEQERARTGRVQVGNLPQQEKEIDDKDAESIKGGGGLSGGVLPPDEGNPQKNRN